MSVKKQPLVWGTPEYLRAKFDDVVSVSELSRKCKDTKAVKAAVAAVSSKDDRLGVHKVYRAEFKVPGGEARTGVIAWISLGLNGGGSQVHYLGALGCLVAPGEFRIFDCSIDAVDDLADFLVTYTPNGVAEKLLREPGDGNGKKCAKTGKPCTCGKGKCPKPGK